MFTLVFFGMLVALIAALAVNGFKIIQQSETMVIERLGRYYQTLPSGINIIWPVIDKARSIDWKYIITDINGKTIVRKETITRIDLRETVYDFPKQNVITRDNVAIEINALLYFQITDPKRSVYEIANLPDALEKLTQTTLRNVIGELDLDHTLTSRDTINQKLRAILDEAIKVAMEKQMRAERDRRAIILEAEGQKQAIILQAEGDRQAEINKAEGIKQALILKASGEAEARVLVADGEAVAVGKLTQAIKESGGNPTSYLLALKYIESMKEMVSGKDNKVVYIPYEATALLGSVGSIRNLFDAVQSKT